MGRQRKTGVTEHAIVFLMSEPRQFWISWLICHESTGNEEIGSLEVNIGHREEWPTIGQQRFLVTDSSLPHRRFPFARCERTDRRPGT
jgi:hypothetical protein